MIPPDRRDSNAGLAPYRDRNQLGFGLVNDDGHKSKARARLPDGVLDRKTWTVQLLVTCSFAVAVVHSEQRCQVFVDGRGVRTTLQDRERVFISLFSSSRVAPVLASQRTGLIAVAKAKYHRNRGSPLYCL